MDKEKLLGTAELADAFRLFPRLFLLIFMSILWSAHDWFTGIPLPSPEQVDYIQWVWGATAAATGFYVATGRKWGG